MVKALDCRSDEDVHAGLIPVTGIILMMMVEHRAAAQASTKYKARGSEATENANAKHKA